MEELNLTIKPSVETSPPLVPRNFTNTVPPKHPKSAIGRRNTAPIEKNQVPKKDVATVDVK